jgi:N-methylhydantoinase A
MTKLEMKSSVPLVRLAVDIGGTFTDIVLEAGAKRFTRKVLTTITEPERAVIDGASRVLQDAALRFADIDVFVHGTTLATNAVLERRGAVTALVATQGFRDVLEIATEGRYDQYDLQIEKRPPLVARSMRMTVPERIAASGNVLLALDEVAVLKLATGLKASGVESVGICFLHAYANGAHEQRARDLLTQEMPGVSISISSEVCPEIREYERTSTTVANAYVQPLVARYLGRMRTQLSQQAFRGALYLVTSNGSLTSLEAAQRFPVRLIESGPAGGAIFAADVAARAGEHNVISFDMGGTTAKICLIKNFSPDTDRVYEVDRAARFQKGSGLPLRIPVIDLVEIGAGGGSIAQVDALKNVTVGPQSAGSEPGPACYGRGGFMPTVTDADAVLGLIDPASFAGGTVPLDIDAAATALSLYVGQPLGMTARLAAYAVHEMVCESMASAARAHAVEKGKSTSDHTMIAFGGAAPLHAARVAEKIGACRILIPPNAGVGSAVGFLRAPVSYELVRSRHTHVAQFDGNAISAMLQEMEQEARALVEHGARGRSLDVRRLAFMRYVGQGQEIAVAVPLRALTSSDANGLIRDFETAYAGLFNRIIPGATQEILSWSVLVSAGADGSSPDAPAGTHAHAHSLEKADALKRNLLPDAFRSFFDGKLDCAVSVPLYRRERLDPGVRIAGPALIAERETTTFVSAVFDACIDVQGNILMQRKATPAAPK